MESLSQRASTLNSLVNISMVILDGKTQLEWLLLVTSAITIHSEKVWPVFRVGLCPIWMFLTPMACSPLCFADTHRTMIDALGLTRERLWLCSLMQVGTWPQSLKSSLLTWGIMPALLSAFNYLHVFWCVYFRERATNYCDSWIITFLAFFWLFSCLLIAANVVISLVYIQESIGNTKKGFM